MEARGEVEKGQAGLHGSAVRLPREAHGSAHGLDARGRVRIGMNAISCIPDGGGFPEWKAEGGKLALRWGIVGGEEQAGGQLS